MQETQETRVRSLGQEDPLEEDGTTLQCSYLENPTDRGACWATVHRITKSQTKLRDGAQVQGKTKPFVG